MWLLWLMRMTMCILLGGGWWWPRSTCLFRILKNKETMRRCNCIRFLVLLPFLLLHRHRQSTPFVILSFLHFCFFNFSTVEWILYNSTLNCLCYILACRLHVSSTFWYFLFCFSVTWKMSTAYCLVCVLEIRRQIT